MVTVLVTQNGHKVMVGGTTHVFWVQHRSLEVQHPFENPRFHCMTFENSFMGMKQKYNMVHHIPKYSKPNYDHGQTPFDQQNNMLKFELRKLSMFPNVIKIEFLGC